MEENDEPIHPLALPCHFLANHFLAISTCDDFGFRRFFLPWFPVFGSDISTSLKIFSRREDFQKHVGPTQHSGSEAPHTGRKKDEDGTTNLSNDTNLKRRWKGRVGGKNVCHETPLSLHFCPASDSCDSRDSWFRLFLFRAFRLLQLNDSPLWLRPNGRAVKSVVLFLTLWLRPKGRFV